jgi:hypothetical protein
LKREHRVDEAFQNGHEVLQKNKEEVRQHQYVLHLLFAELRKDSFVLQQAAHFMIRAQPPAFVQNTHPSSSKIQLKQEKLEGKNKRTKKKRKRTEKKKKKKKGKEKKQWKGKKHKKTKRQNVMMN